MTRSSELECSEFRQARTGFQECDELIMLAKLAHFLIPLSDDRVVQHGAVVLTSEAEVSGHGKLV